MVYNSFFMKATFLFLGTGSSTGVPVIGCTCAVCTSASSFNKRLRASGLIRVGGKQFLIDAGPDFRTQALRWGISHLDAVILTHTHFDHIGGIDDLRALSFFQKEKIPCLLSKDTLDELKLRYHYLMQPQVPEENAIPYTQLDFKVMQSDFGQIEMQGYTWKYVSYYQLGMKVTGYLVGDLAYISDIREYSKQVVDSLQGVHTLILGALRYTPSKGHFSIDEAIVFAEEVGAAQTYLTHIGHELDHEEASKRLPEGIFMSYDGLEIDFQMA
jgi:phosphoribosyl 1,2-cyclic phosphate phosphodiesterase